MNPAATKPAKGKPTRKDYVSRFAEAVTRFSSKEENGSLLGQIPQTLVDQFEAARCELWLWDESSHSVYLTHVAGQEAGRRRDYASLGEGAIGAAAKDRAAHENVALSERGQEEREIAARSGLSHGDDDGDDDRDQHHRPGDHHGG